MPHEPAIFVFIYSICVGESAMCLSICVHVCVSLVSYHYVSFFVYMYG